ncbi:hypothetical protein UlMin_039950 [Ulmus minor]
MAEVEIVEICKVVPSKPSSLDHSTTPNFLPPTFFDIRWLRLPPIQTLLFYQLSTPKPFFDSILPRLKDSLSLTLHHFLPLAGTLTWTETSNRPFIQHLEGDSVSLTVAKSNADFFHLSGNHVFCEAKSYHPLVPNLEMSHQRTASLALQVTLFPNHGFSLGLTMNPAILDGQTFSLFIKSWAFICKSLEETQITNGYIPLSPELEPFYDRSQIKDPVGLEEHYTNQWLSLDGPNNKSLILWERKVPPDAVRGTFILTRAKLETLRKLAKDNHTIRVSTFSLACAYTWVCLVKAEDISNEQVHLVLNVDCRSRLEPPLPPTYFGKCIRPICLSAETKSLKGKHGLVLALKTIAEGIKSLEKGILNGAENWLSMLTSFLGNSSSVRSRVYSVAASPRLGIYSADFGWGRPRKVDYVSIDSTGAISVSENVNGDGGVEIGLALKKHHMEAFASLFFHGLDAVNWNSKL